MEVTGKIIAKLPKMEGTSKAGRPWQKQEYVLETHETYPKKVKFDFFGDKVDQYPLEIGDEVTVSYDIESREFNNRWYTDIRAWKAEKATTAAPAQAQGQPAQAAVPTPDAFPQAQGPAFDANAPQSPTDDLPF